MDLARAKGDAQVDKDNFRGIMNLGLKLSITGEIRELEIPYFDPFILGFSSPVYEPRIS